jgi:hypothetical protein
MQNVAKRASLLSRTSSYKYWKIYKTGPSFEWQTRKEPPSLFPLDREQNFKTFIVNICVIS